MKNNVHRLIWLCGLGLAFFCQAEEVEKPKINPPKESFIKMDLLRRKTERPKKPVRNLFLPGRSLSSEMSADRGFTENMTEELQQDQEMEPGASVFPQSQLQGLDLRFLGYVFSGEKIVALVQYQGEALALEKGDRLDEQFRITEITRTEITILGPDSRPYVFFLEGEQ